MTFGIPCNVLPLNENEQFDLTYHRQWLRHRRELEAQQQQNVQLGQQSPAETTTSFPPTATKTTSNRCHRSTSRQIQKENVTTGSSSRSRSSSAMVIIPVPRPFDVICGRDKLAQNHKGNHRYQYFIETNRQEYEQADKDQKTELANKIVKLVMEDGRFIKECDAGWVELSMKEARDKVGNAFRSRRKKLVKSQKSWILLQQKIDESDKTQAPTAEGARSVLKSENDFTHSSEPNAAGSVRMGGEDDFDEQGEVKRPKLRP